MIIKGMIFIGKNRSFSYFRKLTQHIHFVLKNRPENLFSGNLFDFLRTSLVAQQ